MGEAEIKYCLSLMFRYGTEMLRFINSIFWMCQPWRYERVGGTGYRYANDRCGHQVNYGPSFEFLTHCMPLYDERIKTIGKRNCGHISMGRGL